MINSILENFSAKCPPTATKTGIAESSTVFPPLQILSGYALTSRRVANMSEAPLWIANDKYEEVGIMLYGKDQ